MLRIFTVPIHVVACLLLSISSSAIAVIGGTQVPNGQWNEVSSHNCSGVLIAPRWVLTAAHCAEFNDMVQLAHRTESIPVANIYLYPNWQNTYDIALLELAESAETEPALVAHGCASGYIVNDAVVTLVGWGANHSNPTPAEMFNSNLYQGVTTIVDDQCADTVQFWCENPGGEFIAGGEDVDTCPGDSGGPVYVMTDIGPLVAGITARTAIAAARTDPVLDGACGVPEGGVYVRPDAVMPWIEQQMGESLPEPDCVGTTTPGENTSPSDPDDIDIGDWFCSNANNQQFPGQYDENDPFDYYGANDGCDCGCGAIDPDCPSNATAASCDWIFCNGNPVDSANIGQCATSSPVEPAPEPPPVTEPEQNPPSTEDAGPPASWSCNNPSLGFEDFPGQFYAASDGCDCGCGAVDPDCGGSIGIGQCEYNWCATGIDPNNIGNCL